MMRVRLPRLASGQVVFKAVLGIYSIEHAFEERPVSASRGAHDHIDTVRLLSFAFVVTWPIEREDFTEGLETAVQILWVCLLKL
jgi:hypothetical protein